MRPCDDLGLLASPGSVKVGHGRIRFNCPGLVQVFHAPDGSLQCCHVVSADASEDY